MATKNALRRDERIQDAIHGIIDFHPESRPDRAAWRLLQTPDFQRLRRIKQLGTSEFVFPSASHSRFAHSIGVFHSARRLVGRIRREIATERAAVRFDEERAETAILAALMHDLGHGPFSHVFERARKAIAERRGQGAIKTHEDFSADMIRDRQMRGILEAEGFDSEAIAEIVCTKPPRDMYHAIVSGTFDADRMDYMMRDKYMTGIGEGGFDTNWIMDNVRVAQRGDEAVLCLAHKALTAAEEFLLGRYHLHRDIYLHKTSRGMECLLQLFFDRLAQEAEVRGGIAGLDDGHPLVRFFADRTDGLAAYRELDDVAVWSALQAVARRGEAESGGAGAADIARRVLERDVPACIDVTHRFPEQRQRQIAFKKEMKVRFKGRFDESVFFDSCPLSFYDRVGGDAQRQHERLLIQLPNGALREIAELSDSIVATALPVRRLERYYFLDEETYRQADALARNWREEWR